MAPRAEGESRFEAYHGTVRRRDYPPWSDPERADLHRHDVLAGGGDPVPVGDLPHPHVRHHRTARQHQAHRFRVDGMPVQRPHPDVRPERCRPGPRFDLRIVAGVFQRHRHRASRLQVLAHRVEPGALAFERELEPGSTFGACMEQDRSSLVYDAGRGRPRQRSPLSDRFPACVRGSRCRCRRRGRRRRGKAPGAAGCSCRYPR